MKAGIQEIKDYYSKHFYDGRSVYAHFCDQVARDVGEMGIKWSEIEPYLIWPLGDSHRIRHNQAAIHTSLNKRHGITFPMLSIHTKDSVYVFNGWMALAELVQPRWLMKPIGNWCQHLARVGGCRLPRGMQRKVRKGGRHGRTQ